MRKTNSGNRPGRPAAGAMEDFAVKQLVMPPAIVCAVLPGRSTALSARPVSIRCGQGARGRSPNAGLGVLEHPPEQDVVGGEEAVLLAVEEFVRTSSATPCGADHIEPPVSRGHAPENKRRSSYPVGFFARGARNPDG